MARKKTKNSNRISEKDLSKGELRKLNALRKSLGDEIAEEAFGKWYEQSREGSRPTVDPNIEIIESALTPHLSQLQFPRGGGYVLRRGRGRVIVEPIS